MQYQNDLIDSNKPGDFITMLRLFFLGIFLTIVFVLPLSAYAQDTPVVAEFISKIIAGWKQYGALGALAAGVAGVVAVFRLLSPSLWDRLPRLGKLIIIFLTSGVGAGLAASLGGSSMIDAIVGGVVAALAAIGARETVRTSPLIPTRYGGLKVPITINKSDTQ